MGKGYNPATPTMIIQSHNVVGFFVWKKSKFTSDWKRIKTKDIFLFACYTGLSYIDVKQQFRNHLVKGIDGRDWIHILNYFFVRYPKINY